MRKQKNGTSTIAAIAGVARARWPTTTARALSMVRRSIAPGVGAVHNPLLSSDYTNNGLPVWIGNAADSNRRAKDTAPALSAADYSVSILTDSYEGFC